MAIYFSDLHLRPESEQVCFDVLERVEREALADDKVIVFLGDFFQTRYSVPVSLLNRVRETLFRWSVAGVQTHLLPGNHDQIDWAGRHALEVFQHVPGVVVHTLPGWDALGLWLPYRKDPRELAELVLRGVPAGAPKIAHLHHGIMGATMNNGMVAGDQDGIPPDVFAAFDVVFCGHWHRHHQVRNCVYAGSPWQTRPDEAGQAKGVLRVQGARWQFVQFVAGRQFHDVVTFDKSEIAAVRPGDVVRISAGSVPEKQLQQLVTAIRGMGADVQVRVPEQEARGPRLGIDVTAPLREQAAKYVQTQQLPDGLDMDYLMRLFDEVVSS